MMVTYLLDTHVWVWWHLAPLRLSPAALTTIRNTESYEELLLCSISILELGTLVNKGKISISMPLNDWVESAIKLIKIRVVDLTLDDAVEAAGLPVSFHNDPADRLIVAAARRRGTVIITADRAIRDYPHVKTLW